MAQQIQFIYLTQSDYDNLNPKNTGRIYFTSDTHRIYKGSDLYAATTFDQLNFSSIQASSITVDGSAVSLEGHGHSAADIEGLASAIAGASNFASIGHTHSEYALSNHTHSIYASTSHSHVIADVTNLSSILSGITYSSMEKDTVTADVGYFGEINVSGSANLTVNNISASAISVNGTNVALEGHTHSEYAASDHVHPELSGLTSSSITKDTGTFTNLVVTNASLDATSITASGVEVNGGIQASTVSASSATFQSLTVTGEVTMSLSSVDFQNINASSLTVNGSAVSLEGHSHSASEISGLDAVISAATSSFALTGHTHAISDITSLATKVSGLTSSKVEKTNGVFTNLSTTNLVVSSATIDAISIEASSMTVNGTGTFNAISASTATFGDINVTGTASLNATHVSASTLTADSGTFTNLTVGGSSVALVGHTHPASEVTGLQSVLDGLSSTYALASHSHAISDITNLSTVLTGITESAIEKDTVTADIGYFRLLSVSGSANFAVNTVSANAVTVNGTEVALSGHTHSVADIDGLSTALGGFASSGHTHDELSGLTSSTIDRLSGSFNALTASTATFGSINVTSSATFDITNLVADTITVSDLDLTGTLTVSSTAVSAMTVTDLSVTGTLMLNSKSIATQEYVLAQISAAIGQILASAY